MLPDWTDPRNVGSAFRLADAAGVEHLILAGSTPRPPNRRIDRTARSTVRTVPYTYVRNAAAYLDARRGGNRKILALEVTDRSYDLLSYRPVAEELILVAGSEASGLSQEVLDRCDEAIMLPMYGQNSSMNVSVALGAALYLLLVQLQ